MFHECNLCAVILCESTRRVEFGLGKLLLVKIGDRLLAHVDIELMTDQDL